MHPQHTSGMVRMRTLGLLLLVCACDNLCFDSRVTAVPMRPAVTPGPHWDTTRPQGETAMPVDFGQDDAVAALGPEEDEDWDWAERDAEMNGMHSARDEDEKERVNLVVFGVIPCGAATGATPPTRQPRRQPVTRHCGGLPARP